MNDMENLYEEYKRLRDELSEKELNEVGAFELRSYRRRLEELHRRNYELQDNLRLSKDVDVEELRQVFNFGDRIWEEIRSTLIPVVEVIDIKMALGKQFANERNHIKELKEENLKTLKTLVNQNKRFKKKVDEMTDSELKTIFEEKLKVDEETIQKLKDLDASYEKRLADLSSKLKTIALGGVLNELEETKKDSEGLDKEEAEQLTDKMVSEADEKVPGTEVLDEEEDVEKDRTASEGLPGVEFEGVDPVTPINETDDLTRGLDDELPENILPPFPTPTVEPTEEPVPTLGEDELDEEPIPILGEDELNEEPVPTLGDDELSEEPLPVLGEDEPEEEIPTLDDEPTVEPEPEIEEETPVRTKVKQPKAGLWQKIQTVLLAAQTFLLAAIGTHTGLALNNERVEANTDTEIIEETENETIPETTQDEIPDTQIDNTIPSPSVDPTAPIEPTQPETPTQPEAAIPSPSVSVDENNVVLNPGESVYDSQTGIEVGYTGTAVQETDNGYVPQEDRELDSLNNNAVVVTNDDLQPDPVQPELPRTGQEVSEEEARLDMTQGEQDNLDLATADYDWENFFNDGPTL